MSKDNCRDHALDLLTDAAVTLVAAWGRIRVRETRNLLRRFEFQVRQRVNLHTLYVWGALLSERPRFHAASPDFQHRYLSAGIALFLVWNHAQNDAEVSIRRVARCLGIPEYQFERAVVRFAFLHGRYLHRACSVFHKQLLNHVENYPRGYTRLGAPRERARRRPGAGADRPHVV